MNSLKDFAVYVLDKYLEEYVTENLGCVQTMEIPIMRFFEHLPEDQIRAISKQGAVRFLESLRDGTALEIAAQTLRQWETDTIPGIPKTAISPSDLVLVYTCQKLTLYKFILLYSSDPHVNMQLVRELEEYYAIVQNDAVKLLFRMQKETETELAKKNGQLEEAQSIASLGSWEYDMHTMKITWSKEMYSLYGIENNSEELTVEQVLSFYPEKESLAYKESMKLLVDTGKPFRVEHTIIRRDGEKRIMQIQAYPVIDSNGKITEIHGTTQDITEIRQAELEREISKQKDEFMSIASHELKTPLTSVKAYVDLMDHVLKENNGAMPELQKYVLKAKDNVLKLHSLIADLLDISKINAGKLQLNPVEFNFKDVLRDCVETIGHLSPHHKVVVQGNDNITICADKHRIEQVLMNYLTNAVKYSPKYDKIVVHVSEENNQLQVAVTDFGIGIPKEKQERLFDRFYRVNEDIHSFQGLGIGLYISAQIINRHNGRVWVKSAEGEGSTFFFTLPLK